MKSLNIVKWIRARNKQFVAQFTQLPVNFLLYSLLALLSLSVLLAIISRIIMNNSLQQQQLATHTLFELNYAHNIIIRDADVTMRGYGIIKDERYLYRSNEYLQIDLQDNFKRLDSLLKIQGYPNTDPKHFKAVEDYKKTMSDFVLYHGKMIQLIKANEMATFHEEFSKDPGADLWPVFTHAIELVSKFENNLTTKADNRYQFFSMLVVYVQLAILILSFPVIVHVVQRLKNEKQTSLLLEQRKLMDETNRVKENMLSMMSHEIRTPLNSMIGLTHVLKARDPRPDQVSIIHSLKDSGDHLLHLVNDILDYNRMQAKRLELEQRPFNLTEVFQQVHAMFHRMADERGLQFHIQTETNIPVNLIGDPTRLIQILSNLIHNAIKFTPAGSLSLYVRQEQCTHGHLLAEFTVADTGIGIPFHKQSSLFEAFSQIDNGIQRQAGGTGLGLMIVKNLTELMNGTVQVNSTVGVGTFFIITIPFAIEEATATVANLISKQPEQYQILNGKTILYVEDVVSNQFLITTLLDDHHIICVIACDGQEAIAKVKQNTYDLILMDIQMPDLNGYEVMHFIRNDPTSLNKHIPVILFSAYSDISEDQVNACGANDYIGKPFNPDDLLHKIREQIQHHSDPFAPPSSAS